jgi:hypothetical protein
MKTLVTCIKFHRVIQMASCDQIGNYHWLNCSWIINEFEKYQIKHEQPIFIWCKNSSRRREFVYQIKIGCECFIVLIKRPILWVHWRSNFKNKHCLSRENQGWSLCKLGQIFMRIFIYFEFSSWIINEFYNYCMKYW